MKKLCLSLALVIALVAPPFSPVACTTTQVATAQTDALNGLKTIRASVEAAVKIFNVGYQAGTYNEAQRTQLGILYAKYLAADTATATALNVSTSDTATIVANVTSLAGAVLTFVQSLKGAP